MRFAHQNNSDKLPEINLIPMMNAMLAILAFFVVLSMTLGSDRGVNIELPDDTSSDADNSPDEDKEEPPTLKLDPQGQLLVAEKPVSIQEARASVKAYLEENPEEIVLLYPSKTLAYEKVIQTLTEMRDVGGDRIVLAIESEPQDSQQDGQDSVQDGE